MSETENTEEIFGRKIFFLNPAYSVKKDIVAKLQDNEFEVYIIDNYRDAKNLLRKNRNSILFINIDAQLSVGSWFNFIRSFEKEEILSTIYIAVITERLKQADSEVFEKHGNIEGGVIDFEQGIDAIAKKIDKILESTNAKGRRQYVRANLSYDKDASLFWNHGSKMHQLKLLDISSVGMAVKVPKVLENQIIAKNFLLQDVTMRLGTKQLLIQAVIFAVKQTAEGTIWILLLHPSTVHSTKLEIRHYVSKTIQERLMTTINNDHKDDIDYSQLNYFNIATKSRAKGSLSPFSQKPGHNA